MKTLILFLASLSISLNSLAYNDRQAKRQSEKQIQQHGSRQNFPTYQTRIAPNGNTVLRDSRPINDSFGNKVTSDHINRVELGRVRSESEMRARPEVRREVERGNGQFDKVYHGPIHARIDYLNDRFDRNRYDHSHYHPWWGAHGFYGGFYYPFRPIVNINTYFYNPMVYWMFVPAYSAVYYSSWYNSSNMDAYPALGYPFMYHGLYLPTDNLKALLMGVSAMPVDKQVQFRAAITKFTKSLAQESADKTGKHVRFSTGDIVITHYEIKGVDEAIVIDGFVNISGIDHEFKGLLDLQVPSRSVAFVPASLTSAPASNEAAQLAELNSRIEVFNEASSSQPAETEIMATPAEVTADPK